MFDHSEEKEVTSHEKEKPSRITSDAKDWDKIRKRLTCIAPPDPYSHPASPEMVNAHDPVDIENGQLGSFEDLAWWIYSFIQIGIDHGSEEKSSKVWEQ